MGTEQGKSVALREEVSHECVLLDTGNVTSCTGASAQVRIPAMTATRNKNADSVDRNRSPWPPCKGLKAAPTESH